MKLHLEFNLPEEQDEADLALKGPRLEGFIRELENYFRSVRKYGTERYPDGSVSQEIIEGFEEFYYELKRQNDL